MILTPATDLSQVSASVPDTGEPKIRQFRVNLFLIFLSFESNEELSLAHEGFQTAFNKRWEKPFFSFSTMPKIIPFVFLSKNAMTIPL